MITTRSAGRAGRTRSRRRSTSSIGVVLCAAAALLASCGQATVAHGVSLLPSVTAKGQSWHWTAACATGPSRSNTCAASAPDVGNLQLNADDWNLGGGSATAGGVDMSLTLGGQLAVRGALPSAPPCTAPTCVAPSANTWVRGYPSVLYGINQCSAATSAPVSTGLRLPIRVGAIPSDLVGTTTYAARAPGVTYDVAYDMWLNPSDTRTPCKGDGALEVMVWTDYDAQALLPGSSRMATANVPYSVNGVVQPQEHQWSIYTSNIYGNGHTVPWGGTVWFILDQPDVVGAGTVNVDLSSVLSTTGSLLRDDFGWHDFGRDYWLDTVPFGIEFGPADATTTGTGSSNFSLDLSSYCLSVGTTTAAAGCEGLSHS